MTESEQGAVKAVTAAEAPYGDRGDGLAGRVVTWAETPRLGVGIIDRERRWLAHTRDGKVVYLADVERAGGAIPEGATGETAGLITRLCKLEESVQELRRKVER